MFNNKEFICTKRNSDNQIYIYLRHMFKELGLELTHNLNLFYNEQELLNSLAKIDIKGINVVLFNINSLDALFDKLNEKNNKYDFNLYKKALLDNIVNNFSVSKSVKIPKTYFSTLIDFIKSKEMNSILEKENLLFKIEIEELKQKALVHDKSLLSSNFQDMKQISSVIGIGRNRLFNLLRENKVLINGGYSHNLPYQKFIDLGYFVVRRVTITRTSGEEIKNQTLVTPKGILFINKLFNSKSLISA
ncbi:MAG: phage antirepressor KilAC domain-containing protein [Candidatus Sericytochromatia bacterium]